MQSVIKQPCGLTERIFNIIRIRPYIYSRWDKNSGLAKPKYKIKKKNPHKTCPILLIQIIYLLIYFTNSNILIYKNANI